MNFNIKEAAADYLATKVAPDAVLVLATDDGSNKYSTIGGTCAIGDKFQLVELATKDPEFDIELQTSDGRVVYTSNNEATFLGNGLTLDFAHNSLVLKNDSGLLDGAVTINHFAAQQPLATADLKALGNQIC